MTKFLTTSDSATFCTRSVETTNQRLAKRHLTTTKRPLTTSTTRTTSKRLLLRGAKLLFQYVIIIILIHHLPFSLNRNEHNEHNRNHNRNQLSSSPTVSNGDHKHHLSFRFFAQALQHTNLSPNVLPAPSFIKSMDSLNVRENTPVNEVIYTLEATIESDFAADVRILYDIEETQLFALEDRRSGRVRVAKQIDREQTGDSVSFLVIATPYLGSRPGAQTRLSITVYILDENDNAPKFERVVVGRQEYDQQALAHRIRLNVSEDTPANSTVVDLIEAVDPDTVSSNPLGALCLDCEPEFRLSPKTANSLNDRLEWSIVLVRPLVHIPRNNLRQLNVIVSDGKFNSSIEFEITIDDVQNRAPHFISSTTCVVQENTPIDRTILTLEAIDGDALALEDGPIVSLASVNSNRSATTGASSGPQQSYAGRQIVYDFVDPTMGGRSSSRQDDFKLHPLTGQLQVANRLDREAYLDRAGVLSLQVRARELTVDAGTVAVGPDDLYESILNKLAPFIDQSDNSTTISEITVILMDVNDNSPRWLNATEIEQMSRAPVWHQRLPSDRDTGRNYQLQVRENSLPGSPLTNKNEMFVYDLDSGDNAEFEIRLEDPFNLFDVEPKRVSGFSSVTLKLANTAQGSMGGGGHHAKTRQQQQLQQVLDYENVNERKYIVQLYAQEIRTNERLKSKAQIQINVIDVNDNAPEFKEAAYVANIREDARPGKMVKLVQATDRDEVSKELRYSLHGQSAYLFDVNAQTGLITVAKCADQHHQTPQQPQSAMAARRFVGQTGNQHHYQQQQQQIRPCIDFETQRMHHLMVEASDGELSSKVPFVVYVEDASDNAPTFALPIVDVVIEEGAQRLEPPIRIEATDVDQTSTLSYSIVEGNFEGFFAINNATGELQLTRAIRIPHDDLSAGGLETSSSSIESGAAGGGLSARRQQQFNKMTLIVQASDGEHKTNGTIRIDILDANDNAPEFSRPAYEKEISELAAPGQSVLTVRAFDVDRGNNARVSYRLERGSHGQFDINELSGEISVSQSARPFDASKRDNYTLEVVAYDHGLVSKSSSVIVVIRVVGVGRRAPEFVPQVQRVTISEHALNNNTIIHRMTVSDPLSLNNPQQQQQGQHHQHNLQPVALMFEPGPVEGLDKNGQPVTEIERLESMISVSTNTGDVVVNSNLNHELAAYINLTLYVSYRPVAAFGSPSLYDLIGQNTANLTAGADPSSNAPSQMTAQLAGDEFRPRSVGYLIISVMDNNDHAPYFAAPWTPSQPELSYQMLEELPVGSILTQLVANDADSKISHYEIDPPNEYFELSSPKSGIIVNKKVIDYDTLMRQTYLSPGAHRVAQSASSSTTSMLQPTTGAGAPSAALILQSNTNNGNNVIQFNVIVYDSGVKQLAAKAIVSVEILPINDNDCKFDYQLYEVNLKENALPDTVVTQVRASDLDVGEEHNSISYHLVGDQKDYFNIDARTGVITVSKRGSIGLDREQLAKPIITLTVVGRDNYQLARAGLGDGSGDQSDASNFRQSRGRTSQVPSSANSLGGSGGSRSCSTTLRIHVEDVNDNPPLFAQKIYEVVAYDIDTKDAPLVKLIVHDDDSKHNTIPAPLSVRGGNTNNNGLLSSSTSSSSSNNNNSYRIVSGNFNDSFNITQSGMIYVTRPLNETLAALDRHDASSSSSGTGNPVIELKVEVRQQGFVPPSGASLGAPQTAVVADECLVRVTIMKINRHPPDWRSETNFIPIEENLRPGSLVTQLRCIDRDFEPAKSSPSSSSWVTHYDVQQQLTTAGQQHTQTNGAGRARQSANQLASSAGDNRRPSPIRYWIKENGVNVLETSEFRLDSVSGNLVTRVALDREKRSDYWLLVACEDNGRPESFETITSLYIAVSDVDDNKPEFLIDGQQQQQQRNAVSISREPQGPSSRAANTASSSQHHKPAAIKTITFVVDEQQSKGLQVGELKAIDRDLKPEQPISYCLLEGNEFQEFVLDELTGVLYTNQTLDREKQAYYDLLVKAINDGQSCDDHLAAWSAATSGGQSTNNNSSTAASIVTTTTKKPGNSSPESSVSTMLPDTTSMVKVRVELQDINDNAPVFRRHTFRAGVHHRALSGTLVTQVAAFDPDNEANGTLTYKISEILLYKTNPIASSTFSAGSSKYTSGYSQYQHHNSHHNHQHQTPSAIKLVQLPFRIDQQGNIYTQQLLTQYQLMSWFDVKIEATETTEPWRTATTRLEIYVYETNNQLKIRINLHPRLIESHRHEVETLLSNATKYTAIINRARSYNTNNNMDFAAASNNMANTKSLLDRSGSSQAAAKIPTLDLSQTPSDQYYRQQQVPFSADMSEPVQSSNIHAIFVDQHRLVNPNLVMEKFDLTSAQLLLSAHNFAGQPSELMGPVGQQQQQSSNWQDTNGNNELAPLIDRVALASIQAAEYQASPSGLAGIDWLESPSVLFVCLSSMLFFIGLLICLVGCCCTSRIKDHIIKVAMDKLVKQQALQAKINERVLAATNQAAYASTNGAGSVLGGVSGQQQQHPNNHLMNGAGHDFMLAQGAGFMSSFDATKGCLNNNYENMSILQRAMEAGEFFDPNYTTLNNNNNNTMTTPAGHLNLGAHYYDASELDNQQEDDNGTGLDANNADKQYQMMNGAGAMDNSVVSLSLEEEYDDDDDEDGDRDMNDGSGNNYDMTTNANSGDLSNGHDTQQKLAKETKLYTNGLNGMVSSHHSRLRQQIPNNKYSHDT